MDSQVGFLGTRNRARAHLFCVSLQESLRLQEQAALETDDGEGLQQTLKDLAQVWWGTSAELEVGGGWAPWLLLFHILLADLPLPGEPISEGRLTGYV
jgi:hypothetical protein